MTFEPFTIDDSASFCERAELLDRISWIGTKSSSVEALASEALRMSARTGQSLPACILKIVQEKIPYKEDPTYEEWFFPVEMTIRKGGNCKHLSSVIVAICRRLGIQANIIWIDQKCGLSSKKCYNHVAASVFHEGKWRWADASVRGARFGESPYDALVRLGQDGSAQGIAQGTNK